MGINIEISTTSEVMTHRIGRAGRFGARGESIFLISEEEEESFDKMITKMKLELTRYSDFKKLLSDCAKKLQISSFLKEKEETKPRNDEEDDRIPDIIDQSNARSDSPIEVQSAEKSYAQTIDQSDNSAHSLSHTF